MSRWKPYVPVAKRRARARAAALKQLGPNAKLQPAQCAGRSMASTFWGKAWCANLEAYSDFANRLPRGRTYARNGSVLNLRILPDARRGSKVEALVAGSEPYHVVVHTKPLPVARWRAIQAACAGQIDSVVELLGGRLSHGVMAVVTRQGDGLFPAPEELTMHCTCPDWATMCKHVAATLYGVGARLDEDPGLLFTLRGVDPGDLITEAMVELKPKRGRGRVLASGSVASIFGLDMQGDESFELVQITDPKRSCGNETIPAELKRPTAPTGPRAAPDRTRGLVPAKRRLAKRARGQALATLNATQRRLLSLVFNEPGLDLSAVSGRFDQSSEEVERAATGLVDVGLLSWADD